MKKKKSKKEIAAELAEAAAERAALVWSDDVPTPDIPRPENSETTTGFMVVGVGEYARAETAWSTVVTHGWGRSYPDRYGGGSQGGVALFSSEVAAWKAARGSLQRAFAKKLRAIDLEITKAIEREAANKEGE